MKRIIVVASLACASLAEAADVTFVNKDNRGDLADPLAWDRTVEQGIPLPTDRMQFAWNSYGNGIWATEDLTFAGMRFATGGYTMTFDMRDEKTKADPGPRKITLTAAIDGTGNWGANFKGGFWDVHGNALCPWGSKQTVKLSDGVIFNIAGTLAIGNATAGSSLALSGGSVITTKVVHVDHITGSNNSITITDGSKLIVTDSDAATAATFTDNGGGRTNGFVVAGVGSELIGSESAIIGGGGRGSYLFVTNGATVKFGKRMSISFYNGNSGADCFVCVRDPGSSLTADMLLVGTRGGVDGSTHASLLVENGAVVSVGDFRIGGHDYMTHDNTTIVSNATFEAKKSFMVGSTKEGSRRQVFRAVGSNTRLKIPENKDVTTKLFGPTGDSRFELDGVALTNDGYCVVGVDNSSSLGGNVIDLRNGAEIVAARDFLLVGKDYLTPGGNLLNVESGSRVSAAAIATAQHDNEMSVSNGTLLASTDILVPAISYSPNVPLETQLNNTLRIAGSMPLLCATNGTIDISRKSHLVIDYPADGYVENLVPMRAKSLSVGTDCDLAVTGLEEAGQRFFGRRTVKLAETTDGVTIPAGVLEAACEKLPNGCNLWVENKCLMLKVKGKPTGMTLILR